MKLEHIGMVGYGEVGKVFTAGLKNSVGSVSAWDIKFDAAGASPTAARDAELAHAAQAGVHVFESLQALCEKADLVISAVTAANTWKPVS